MRSVQPPNQWVILCGAMPGHKKVDVPIHPNTSKKQLVSQHGVDSAPQQKRLNQLQTKINQKHNFVFDSGEGIERANEMLDTMFKTVRKDSYLSLKP